MPSLGVAELTPRASDVVSPPRVDECPVQLEAVLEGSHRLAERDELRRGRLVAIEVRIVRVHIAESIRMNGYEDRIDPDLWRPLIMNFCHFYGLGGKIHPSTLAEIPESAYRPQDATSGGSSRLQTRSGSPQQAP